jgi:hypothetical protein
VALVSALGTLILSDVFTAATGGLVAAGCSSTVTDLLQAQNNRIIKNRVSCDFIFQISTFALQF